ncbi:MAG: sugar phosphate nucleotidyltransferase, partial [Candidatus Nanohaloarchaea archaeon]
DPERFGNPKIKGEKIVDIEEKPEKPHSPYAITGCFGLYNDESNSLFNFIKNEMEPSDRGEYEITDILNWYLDREELTYETLDQFWTDAGQPDALMKASKYMEKKRGN